MSSNNPSTRWRRPAHPADTNPAGDIFGGWLLSQMDVAGGTVAYQHANGRVATIAIEAMKFHKPVFVGDLVSCYADIVRVGNTSLTVQIETYARRARTGEEIKVTEGRYTFVAIDEQGRPRQMPRGDQSP